MVIILAMPIYVYQVILEGDIEGPTFEVEQSMTEPALEVHPITGHKVRRVYQPPNLGVKYTAGSTKNKLETKNVEQAGFTKYERDKLTGKYHKTAGKDSRAPNVIDAANLKRSI